jgi:hypothetical protein
MKITAMQLKKFIRETIEVELNSKKNLNEAMTRITAEEVEAWKNGDWGYVAGDEKTHDMNTMDVSDVTDPERFLHGHEHDHPHDDEGSMVKSRLYAMKQMAHDLCDIIENGDQLPGWTQDHIAVAHENLQQVHGYITGQQHAVEHGKQLDRIGETKTRLSEAHNKITKEEMNAWMRGEWGFISEAEGATKEPDESPGAWAADYEECKVCGFDHRYDPADAIAAHKEKNKPM